MPSRDSSRPASGPRESVESLTRYAEHKARISLEKTRGTADTLERSLGALRSSDAAALAQAAEVLRCRRRETEDALREVQELIDRLTSALEENREQRRAVD